MSRSRRPRCGIGRRCCCCGNAGAARRKRESSWARSDGWPTSMDRHTKETSGPFHHDSFYQGKKHPR